MAGACLVCMDDIGYTAGENRRQGAILLTEGLRTATAASIANANYNEVVMSYQRLHAIAQRSLFLAERQQGRLTTEFWPRELQMLTEFGDEDLAIESAQVLGQRYAGRLMATVTAAFAKQLHKLKLNASRYCTSAYNKARQDLLAARAAAQASATILGRNIGYAEYQARVDTNWNRRAQVVALGRGLLNEAAKLSASAGEGMAAVAQHQVGVLGQSINAFQQQFRSAIDAFSDFARTRQTSTQTRAPGPGTGPIPTQSFGVLASDGQPATYGVLASDGGAVQPGAAPWMFSGDTLMSQLRNPQSGLTAFDQTGSFVSTPEAYARTSNEMMPEATRDNQMNVANMGNKSLMRTGTVKFAVEGITSGFVTIPMNAFGADFSDDLSVKPATGGGLGIPIQPFSVPLVAGSGP